MWCSPPKTYCNFLRRSKDPIRLAPRALTVVKETSQHFGCFYGTSVIALGVFSSFKSVKMTSFGMTSGSQYVCAAFPPQETWHWALLFLQGHPKWRALWRPDPWRWWRQAWCQAERTKRLVMAQVTLRGIRAEAEGSHSCLADTK